MWQALNYYIQGWGQYFAAGVSSRTFSMLDDWTYRAVARLLHRKNRGRHHRAWRYTVGPYQIPWRHSSRPDQRWHQGRGLGTWVNAEHSAALMLAVLRFIPIRYPRQFGQYCPYRAEDRALLRARRGSHRNPQAILASRWLPNILAH